MRHLLHTENIGGRSERWWLNDGIDGDGITVETVQDVEPVFEDVKQRAEFEQHKDLQYLGTIPATVVEELCKVTSQYWGASTREVFSEMMDARTDRAKGLWNLLLTSRDYRRFQADGA